MNDPFLLRSAGPADAAILAAHRVAMFRDIGSVQPASEAALHEASTGYFRAALPSGEYVGWLAYPAVQADLIVAGAGVQLRALLPRPDAAGQGLLLGREGLVLNVYVEPQWRRRGLARRLMTEILHWAPSAGIVRLVLHASSDGRPLYEALGFTPTNEMRYAGQLPLTSPIVGAA